MKEPRGTGPTTTPRGSARPVLLARDLGRLARKSLANGLRLHGDATTLLGAGSWRTALQLAVLAQEEIGKAMLLEEAAFHRRCNDWTEEHVRWFLKQPLRSHALKQVWFAKEAGDLSRSPRDLGHRLAERALGGWTEAMKMKAAYVDPTPLASVRISRVTARREVALVDRTIASLAQRAKEWPEAFECPGLAEELLLWLELWPRGVLAGRLPSDPV